VEKEGLANIDEEERKIYAMMCDWLIDDAIKPDQPKLGVRLIATTYRSDALHVWGSISYYHCR
jgi:hypothetical protein